MPKIVVVIPTYNERENIPNTLDVSLKEFAKISTADMHILVVDGNSPDGTAEVVKPYTQKFENVHLLRKEKGGLGGDYVAGMKYAMHKLDADYVGEMDADLQHDPADVAKFVDAVMRGADVAIGTRFIKGGSIPSTWGFHRKFLSFFGNLYARVMTGMWGAHDITSGFRLSKVKGFLDSVDLDKLYSKRFAYKMDLYYRLHKLGANIAEIPIAFHERDQGESKIQVFTKLNNNDWLDSYIVVSLIFLERLGILKHKRFVKVALIGIFGGGVQIVSYAPISYLLDKFVVGDVTLTLLSFSFTTLALVPIISVIFSSELAIISNFILNRQWAFKDRDKKEGVLKKFVAFNLLSVGSPTIQSVVMFAGVSWLGRGFIREYIYLIIGLWIGLIWNYLSYSKVVWRKSSE